MKVGQLKSVLRESENALREFGKSEEAKALQDFATLFNGQEDKPLSSLIRTLKTLSPPKEAT
jgi:hypothetical protein